MKHQNSSECTATSGRGAERGGEAGGRVAVRARQDFGGRRADFGIGSSVPQRGALRPGWVSSKKDMKYQQVRSRFDLQSSAEIDPVHP